MKFKSVRREGLPSAEKLAELEVLSTLVEAEVPHVETTGQSMPFHQSLALRAIMHALRNVRVGLGWSLDELAIRTGIDKSYLSRLETSRQENITLVTVEKVARALNKRVEFVLIDLEPEQVTSSAPTATG